jgi:hypothetical protein
VCIIRATLLFRCSIWTQKATLVYVAVPVGLWNSLKNCGARSNRIVAWDHHGEFRNGLVREFSSSSTWLQQQQQQQNSAVIVVVVVAVVWTL